MASDDPSVGAAAGRFRLLDGDRERVVLVALPVVGIFLSEAFLFFGNRDYTLWGHVLTLLFCVVVPLRFSGPSSAIRWPEPHFSDRLSVRCLQSLGLVSVFRLVNLGMPVFFQLTLYWLPLIYGPLVPALLLVRRSHSPPERSIGWLGLLAVAPIALAVTVLMAEVEYDILAPQALIPTWSAAQLLFLTVVMVGFVGFVEELLFRGILQQSLKGQFGAWPGLLVASALFGAMHSGYGRPAEVVFAGTIGFVFGVIYDRTGSLGLVTVMHGVLNVFLFAVIPMQGSAVGALP